MPYVEHMPPDVTAQIFWLKNRDPARWRDAWQLEHVTGKYVISDKPLTEAEWIKQTGATVIDGEATVARPTPAIEDNRRGQALRAGWSVACHLQNQLKSFFH